MNSQSNLKLPLRWRWLISWAELCDGICGVLTLGAWQPALALRVRMRAMEHLRSQLEKESDVKELEQKRKESYRIKRLDLPFACADFDLERSDLGELLTDVPLFQNDGWFLMTTDTGHRVWYQWQGDTYAARKSQSETQEHRDLLEIESFKYCLALAEKAEQDIGVTAASRLRQAVKLLPDKVRKQICDVIADHDRVQELKDIRRNVTRAFRSFR